MKKIFPYILMFSILTGIFSPLSFFADTKNNVTVKENKIEADTTSIKTVTTASSTDTSIRLQINVTWGVNDMLSQEGVFADKMSADPKRPLTQVTMTNTTDKYHQYGEVVFNNLTPSTTYNFNIVVMQFSQTTWQAIKQEINPLAVSMDSGTITNSTPYSVSTLVKGQTTFVAQTIPNNVEQTGGSVMPACAIVFGTGTVMGCVAQGIYYVIFQPTSYLFALTGMFFDYTFAYSVQDSSYRSTFVVQGWTIVRDFCNMFFIFILLYIAFATILNLHGFKTKEMIMNVVIIGIAINFSLFASQVIIDASNILARVFYNSDAIKITDGGANGVASLTGTVDANGSMPLSAALVNKVNPQNLIINSNKVNVTKDTKNKASAASNSDTTAIDTGTFILVTLLASVVNIVGMIVFLSVGLIFVSRVIGLWLAMILVPLAFLSYTVPALQNLEMVGWKKWWPETLKLAFLAPVFIFFLYLILKFLETGLFGDAGDKTGLAFVIAIVVPFAFIMILLMKAKDIAKTMSGTMGQMITNSISAVGAVALGAATGGTALLGRKVIGQTLAKASRGDTATQKFETAKLKSSLGDTSAMNKLSGWQKLKGKAGSMAGLGKIYGKDTLQYDIQTRKAVGVSSGLGGLMNKKQKEVGEVDHARHEMDELKKASGLEGVSDNSLTSGNDNTLKTTYNKSKRSEFEANTRNGLDGKGKPIILGQDSQGNNIQGQEAFKSVNRKAVSDKVMGTTPAEQAAAVANGDVENGKLTKAGQLKVENELNIKLNAAVKIATDKELEKGYDHVKEKSREKVGGVERAFSGANKASYDLRKLSDIKSDKREGIFTKIPVALIAALATGVRAGIKGSGLSNGGVKVEGNFLNDLKSTIGDSLKSIKVNVDLHGIGETKSSADPHGGGGGHH